MDVMPTDNENIETLTEAPSETIESSNSISIEANDVDADISEADAGPQASKESVISALDGPSSTDLIKIQELLIGNQLRAVNQKIMLVHKDFKQAIVEMEDKLESKLQQQEELLNQNLQSIREQLNGQASLQEEQNFELRAQVNAIEESHTSGQQLLDTQLQDTTGTLQKLIDETHADLLEKFDSSMNNIRDNQLDRFALSDLLGGIAEQIRTADNIPTVTQHAEHISIPEAANNDVSESRSA